MAKTSHKITLCLLVITFLAGTLRILRALEEARYSVDAYYYFKLAEGYAFYGKDYVVEYLEENMPPLLPWLMAYGYNFGLTPDKTGLIIGIILGALIPIAAFWITLNLFSEDSDNNSSDIPQKFFYALLAAFFVAIHPFFIRISVSCLREILYLPLIAFAIAFAASAIKHKSFWRWTCFALLAVIATLTRREGILLLMIFFIWQVVEFVTDSKKFRLELKFRIITMTLVSTIYLGLTGLLYFNVFEQTYGYFFELLASQV